MHHRIVLSYMYASLRKRLEIWEEVRRIINPQPEHNRSEVWLHVVPREPSHRQGGSPDSRTEGSRHFGRRLERLHKAFPHFNFRGRILSINEIRPFNGADPTNPMRVYHITQFRLYPTISFVVPIIIYNTLCLHFMHPTRPPRIV